MTQLLEAIETERRLTEEEWERVNARFEERLALFDDMVEKAKLITGDTPPAEKPKAKPGPKPKKPKAGNPNRVKTGIKPGSKVARYLLDGIWITAGTVEKQVEIPRF